MIPNPPPGQGPIDPRGAFTPPHGAPMPPAMQPPMPPPMQQTPMMMPPQWFYPPPPPRRSAFSILRGIVAVLVTLIFAFSIMLNIVLLFSPEEPTVVLVKGDRSNEIAVIPLNGTINSAMSARFEKLMREFEDNSSIKALVLEIDSPGGELTASDEIYTRLKKFKEEKKIPVVISMGGMAASGGYYIACAGDYLFAQPTTITANIGVVYERFNFSGLMEKYGVKDSSVTPAGAKFKYIESPFRPDTPEAQAYLGALVEQHYARFKSVVSTGRSGKLKGSIDQIADGRALSASEALADGLIDEVKYADAAYAKAASLAALSNPNVVRYKQQTGLLELLGASSKFNLSNAKAPELQIDRRLLDDLTTPRLMTLYRGG